MRCFICRFSIPVWYKYDGEWYCLDCYRKQKEIGGGE